MSAAVSFKTGWKQDAPDARDHDARRTFLKAAPPPPAKARNADLVKVVNQGQLGSCTANSTGYAVRAAILLEMVEAARAEWQAAGAVGAFDAAKVLADAQDSLEFWSRLFAYYLARAYTGDQKDDTGTQIRLIFQAINKFGYPTESTWSYDDASTPGSKFSKMPSAEAFREAFDQRASAANQQRNLIDYARISSTGTQRIADVKTAVSQRHLVVFGTPVTEKFCSDNAANNGLPIPRPLASDDIAGGHAMAIAGYDDDGAEIPNSWGTGYGGHGGLPPGWCKFGWDYITWSETTDLWIVRRAPLLRKAA